MRTIKSNKKSMALFGERVHGRSKLVRYFGRGAAIAAAAAIGFGIAGLF